MVYGVAYEIPEYALRAEVVRSEAISMGLTGTATHSSLGPFDLASTAALGVPEATTLKIQTGIAEDTLLMASAHKVKWSSSQIVVDVAGVTPIPGVIASDSLNTGSNFASTTSYSLGLGRKLSESTSASLTYSWEDGSGASATSPFTMSNGSKTLSIGVKYTIDALSISGGLSYTKAGDVEVIHMSSGQPSGYTASYTGNSVTAFGLKVGYSF
jgi:long-subunit fatty acid transport protein